MRTAEVKAYVDPNIKSEAEAILGRIGVPVSILVDVLYREIIHSKRVPFELTIPSEDNMTKEELEEMLDEGLRQADNGEGKPADEVFDSIKGILHSKKKD